MWLPGVPAGRETGRDGNEATRPGSHMTTLERAQLRRWICEPCGFIYDPEEGDPDGGVAPGTAFEDIPEDWMCPICGATKADFRVLEPGEFPEDRGLS